MTNTLFDGLLADAPLDRQFAEIPGEPTRFYSYAHLVDVSARFAHILTDWGVRPGDRVAVQVPKSIEAIAFYLATIRVGAVFLPLNTAYTVEEVAYFLGDATPALFLCRDCLIRR